MSRILHLRLPFLSNPDTALCAYGDYSGMKTAQLEAKTTYNEKERAVSNRTAST